LELTAVPSWLRGEHHNTDVTVGTVGREVVGFQLNRSALSALLQTAQAAGDYKQNDIFCFSVAFWRQNVRGQALNAASALRPTSPTLQAGLLRGSSYA
jgi:hypothetical protein